MRRFAHCRVDANHLATANHLRKVGFSVVSLAPMGGGIPDLLVGRPNFSCLVELKDGQKPASKQKLTPKEQEFSDSWTGPLITAYSAEDAATKLLALWRGWA